MPALLLIILTLSIQICACSSTPPRPDIAENTNAHNNSESKEDNRGFDPCLINSKLAVCGNNENTNRK